MAETTPVGLTPPSPDDELAALDDDLSPSDETATLIVEQPAPLGRSWAFDFDAGRHVQAPGGRGAMGTYGDQTLYAWIAKTLRTAKGAHAIYPSDYGMRDPGRLVGRHLTTADYSILETDIHDALTFHPRITDVTDFVWDQDPDEDGLFFECAVVKDDQSVQTVNVTIG